MRRGVRLLLTYHGQRVCNVALRVADTRLSSYYHARYGPEAIHDMCMLDLRDHLILTSGVGGWAGNKDRAQFYYFNVENNLINLTMIPYVIDGLTEWSVVRQVHRVFDYIEDHNFEKDLTKYLSYDLD